MSLKQHATIIVENKNRALKSRSETNFIYQLTQPIKFLKRSDQKQYFIRIENVRLPVSFYNINEFNNVYSNDSSLVTHVQPVGVIIPITEIRNEFQFFNNHLGPLIKLSNQTTISDINIKLLDPNNNIVDIHGVPFGFEIVIYEFNK